MSSHTPGPWIADGVEIRSEFREIDDDGNLNALRATVMFQFGHGYDNSVFREANARLIAAAPRLLEALADCFDELIFLTNSYDLKDADPEIVSRAGELLDGLLTDEQRKARGSEINAQ